MSAPRGIEERIDWFLNHNPSGTGMCAQHTWHSLGGDYGNPPAWGCSDANECVDKVKKSGRFWTPDTWPGPPPRGAWVGWKYGSNGHAALSLGDGRIATTDPSSGAKVGVEPLDYPKRWGFATSGGDYTCWSDQYNAVRFAVGIEPGTVYLSKLRYGQEDSDSVKRLQQVLNSHSLPPPGDQMLPITGNYADMTDEVVRTCQAQHGYGADPVRGSSVGPQQAEHLFAGSGNTIVNDLETGQTPPPPEQEVPKVIVSEKYGTWKWWSGKHTDDWVVHPSEDWIDIPGFEQPASGVKSGHPVEEHFIYLRCKLPAGRSAQRVLQIRFVRSDGDETAYDFREFGLTIDSYPFGSRHVEDGSGISGRWQVWLTGGTDPIRIGTRYAKTYIRYHA